MFPLYLQYLLIDFRQTFVTGASWDTDDPITFLGQKVKVQGHTIAAEAHTTFSSYDLPSCIYVCLLRFLIHVYMCAFIFIFIFTLQCCDVTINE